MTIRQLLSLNMISFCLLLAVWTFTLWYTGARLTYQTNNTSDLAALYLAPQVGVSLQWSATGYSIWVWKP